MTLTEQWKKGELTEDFYYFKMPDGAIEIANEYRLIRYNLTKDADEIEVLAPVPSYEEWRDLQEYKRIVNSYNMKPIDYDIACETVNKLLDEKEKLRNELGLLKESIGKDCGTHYINLFLQENQQLKELLKRCVPFVQACQYNYYRATPEQISSFLDRIDEMLGEKK